MNTRGKPDASQALNCGEGWWCVIYEGASMWRASVDQYLPDGTVVCHVMTAHMFEWPHDAMHHATGWLLHNRARIEAEES